MQGFKPFSRCSPDLSPSGLSPFVDWFVIDVSGETQKREALIQIIVLNMFNAQEQT